jgi:hypothetical protein
MEVRDDGVRVHLTPKPMVQAWLHSRKGKTFSAALDDSSAMWTAIKNGSQAKVISEAQGLNSYGGCSSLW